jgi:hypothetical protein
MPSCLEGSGMTRDSTPQTDALPSRRVSRPLVVLMVAAMLVGCLAALGQFQEDHPETPLPDARPARRDGRIVAGQKVDFITLNLPITQVEEVLGAGKIRPQADSQIYLFEKVGVHVATRKGRVQSILVQTPDLQTAEGIAVGSDVDQILRRYGERYEYEARGSEEYWLHYWSQGIHFSIRGTSVTQIMVATPVMP